MNLAFVIDSLVVALYFAVIVAIGLRAGRSNKRLEDFTVGGRSIPWWAALASIIAAETSAATFLGTPAEGYQHRSFIYAQLAIGTVIARVVIAFIFLKPYYDYRVQSIYEFLGVRFGPYTRAMASATFLVTRVLGIGVRLYLGGMILVVIWRHLFPSTPVSLSTYFWGIVFVAAVTGLYTAVGGIKAVIWTDVLQACLMLGAAGLAIVLLLVKIPGGWASVGKSLGGWDQVRWFETGWDASLPFGKALAGMVSQPYTVFAALLGSTFLTMATHGTDQDMVQRMLTAKNVGKARLSLILSGLMDIPMVLAFLTIGLLLGTYYQGANATAAPKVDNEVFAHFIVTAMPPIARGLVIAGVFGTMMGSTSAALNALATSFTSDFYLRYLRPNASGAQSIRAARIATVVFAALMVAVATGAAAAVLHDSKLTIIPIALGILGYTYGGLLAVFLLGMLTKTRGSDTGNIISMLSSTTAVLILGRVEHFGLGNWLPDWWPKIAWSWYVFLGCVVALSIAVCFRTPPSSNLAGDGGQVH